MNTGMNKSLRQLFNFAIVLFVVLGIASSIIMVVRAAALNSDSRNSRALYHAYGTARGAILAADGTTLAKSDKTDDEFGYQRSYADGALYAPVTGYFSITNPADRGIEASENTLLNGENETLWWSRVKATFTGQDTQGASIETSINPKLQKVAYDALSSQGLTGSVVAIEPSTGRILAMVSTPSYDPNQLATHDTNAANTAYQQLADAQPSPMVNNATSQLYPPGSTFKIIVAAAAIESGKANPDTQISAPREYTLPGTATQLPNAEPWLFEENGMMTMERAFAISSNTAFAKMGVELGADKVNEMATKLGFGSSITVDGTDATGLPMSAVASRFPTGQTDDKLALASIGQGDTVATPLQNALVAAAVANDGKLMKPTLVDRVRSSDLSVVSETSPSVMSTAFSKDTADKLTQMMQSVITTSYPNLVIPNISMAAKTGTAQIGATDSGMQDAWITGFAPAEDPKIAVAVVVHNVSLMGGDAAGPIMKQMVEAALQ